MASSCSSLPAAPPRHLLATGDKTSSFARNVLSKGTVNRVLPGPSRKPEYFKRAYLFMHSFISNKAMAKVWWYSKYKMSVYDGGNISFEEGTGRNGLLIKVPFPTCSTAHIYICTWWRGPPWRHSSVSWVLLNYEVDSQRWNTFTVVIAKWIYLIATVKMKDRFEGNKCEVIKNSELYNVDFCISRCLHGIGSAATALKYNNIREYCKNN